MYGPQEHCKENQSPNAGMCCVEQLNHSISENVNIWHAIIKAQAPWFHMDVPFTRMSLHIVYYSISSLF